MINKKLTSFQQFHSSSIIFWIYESARQLPEMPWVKQSCRATLAVLTAAASSRKAVPTVPTAGHDTNTAEQHRPPEVNWEWPHDKFILSSLSSADGSARSIRSINCKRSAEGMPLCFERSWFSSWSSFSVSPGICLNSALNCAVSGCQWNYKKQTNQIRPCKLSSRMYFSAFIFEKHETYR